MSFFSSLFKRKSDREASTGRRVPMQGGDGYTSTNFDSLIFFEVVLHCVLLTFTPLQMRLF